MHKKLIGLVLVAAALMVPIANATPTPADVDGGVVCTGNYDYKWCGGVFCFYYYYTYKAEPLDINRVVIPSASQGLFCTESDWCTNIWAHWPDPNCDYPFDT